MAVRASVKVAVVDINVGLWSWSGLLNGDTGSPISVINSSALMAQLTSGTLGVGGTCIWQGSLDAGSTWFTLSDQSGVAISMTALIATKMILERPILIRPNVTVGDGTTSLVAALYSRIGGAGGGGGGGGSTTFAALTDAITATIATTNTSVANALAGKQATLVSATNIKTINGVTVLGAGDLVVSGAAAPVTLAVNTSLTSATHGNRTLYASVSGLVFTVNNDATGGWLSGDIIYAEPTGSGTFSVAAGTATFVLPDGGVTSNLSSLSTQAGVVSLEWISANTWRVTSIARSDGASALRFGLGMQMPLGNGGTNFSTFSSVTGMNPVDTSVVTAAATADTPIATYGIMPRVRYTGALAVSRQAGASNIIDLRPNAGGITNGRFPIALGGGYFDANAIANSMFLMGYARSTVAAGSNASVQINGVWMGADASDANMQVMANGPSGTAYKQDLGASFPNAPSKYYVVFIDKNGAGTEFYVQVSNITDGVDSPFYTLNSTTTGSAARMLDVTLTNYQALWIRGTNAGGTVVALMDVGGVVIGKRA